MKIIGLPAIVSTRHRIVMERILRSACGVELNCQLRILVEPDRLRVFPSDAIVKDSVLKEVTQGRLNLPMNWVADNQVPVGGYVYLLRLSECFLVLPGPVDLSPSTHPLGLPCRVYWNRCYLPLEYLRHYGFLEKNNAVVLKILDNDTFILHAAADGLSDGALVPSEINKGWLMMPKEWLAERKGIPRKTMYAVGTDQGLRLSFQDQVLS